MTIRDDLMKELEHEIQFRKSHTQAQYKAHVGEYLDFVKRRDPSYEKWKDREMVYAYIDKLKRAQKSQSTINFIIRGPVGCLFRFSGLRLPVKLPPIDLAVYSGDESLFWTEEQIQSLIHTARTGDTKDQAIIAVATIYAPRVSEILKITKKEIDFKKMVITIPTVKHNLVRRHLIPEEVQYQICKYSWDQVGEQDLRDMLERIAGAAGIERKSRQSFHAFRHALWDELSYSGLTPSEIYDFTGWVKGGTQGFYIHPLKYNPLNDRKVFEKHPFLKFWK